MAFMVGSAEAFDCALYPQMPQSFSNYLQSNISSLANTNVGLSQTFIDMTNRLYQKHNDEVVLANAKAIAKSASMLFDMNIITPLFTIEAVQNAKPLMQRFIMAMPELTSLHNEQRIESYFGSFVDNQPGAIEEQRLDYRMVMDGVITEDAEGSAKWTWYYDDVSEDDVVLSAKDQFNILDTWDIVAQAIAQGIDPTSLTSEKIQD